MKPKVWYVRGDPFEIENKRLAFKAIPFVAATDCWGKIKAYVFGSKAIQWYDFNEFITKLRMGIDIRKKIFLVVDNLPMHHSKIVKDHAESKRVELVFNASYSS